MNKLNQRLQQRKFLIVVILALLLTIVSAKGFQLAISANKTVEVQAQFTDLTSSNISDVSNADGLSFIEFYSASSIDSSAQQMILEQALAPYASKVTFFRLDLDAEPDLADKLGVKNTPSFVLVKGGKKVNSIEGMLGEKAVKAFIDDGLLK